MSRFIGSLAVAASMLSLTATQVTAADKTVVQTVEQYLSVAEKRKLVNAFNHIDSEAALKRAKALDGCNDDALPLKGFVLAVKDNIHVKGMPNTAGTEALRNFVPTKSSPVIERLEKAGAIILGKAGLHELAYGITSNNFAYGAIHNPLDETKTPGGSSGGSAAAVAGGMATAALGTDTGGSARIPAALTGLVGFRPSTGRYSPDEVTLISPTRDTIGLITSSVSDAILMDSVIVNDKQKAQSVDLSKVRIGVPRGYFYENLDPEVARVSTQYLAKLKALGVTLVEADMIDVPTINAKLSFPIVLFETSHVLPAYFQKYGLAFDQATFIESIKSPDVKGVVSHLFSGAITREQYDEALNVQRPLLQAAYANYFKQHNVVAVIFPTTPITARNIEGILEGVMVNGVMQDTFATYIRNADPSSNAGVPSISIPAGKSGEGLTIGMELDGIAGEDVKLLSLALALEEALK